MATGSSGSEEPYYFGSYEEIRPEDELCPCGAAGVQPWRTRDALFSPASVLCASSYFILLLVIWPTPKDNLVGRVMVGLVAALVLVATVVAARAGHRPWCAIRRGLWIGIACLGLPLRSLSSLALW